MELAPWDIPVVILEPGAMRTEIFAVANEAQAKAAATVAKDRTDLYAPQLAAIGATAAGMRMSPPEIMADAILTSLTAARPRARYTVGRDTRLLGLLSRLPLRTQDRLISGVLGLNKAEKAGRSGK